MQDEIRLDLDEEEANTSDTISPQILWFSRVEYEEATQGHLSIHENKKKIKKKTSHTYHVSILFVFRNRGASLNDGTKYMGLYDTCYTLGRNLL